MIVVDASVVVKWFVAEAGHERALAVLEADRRLIAPDFVILETLNVLRRKAKKGEVLAEQAARAAEAMTGFFDELVPAAGLGRKTLEIADTLDHSVYDCAYLACAVERGAILLSADEAFVAKVQRTGYAASVCGLTSSADLLARP